VGSVLVWLTGGGGGVDGPLPPLRSLAIKSLLRDLQQHTKISEDLSNSKTMTFNVKKMLNDGGPGARVKWKRWERNEGRSCRFRLPIASSRRRMGLPRAFETALAPLGPGDVS
jgi:hypothetical protein